MKRELSKINATLTEFRGEFNETVSAFRREFKRLHETDQRIAAAVVRLEAKVEGVGEMIDKRLEHAFSPMHQKLDAIVRLAEDSRYRWAVHADTLLEHDRRLKKLESRQ